MTLANAQAKLVIWQDRLDGLEYQQLTSGKTQEMSLSIRECQRMVNYYESEVARLTNGRRAGARQIDRKSVV